MFRCTAQTVNSDRCFMSMHLVLRTVGDKCQTRRRLADEPHQDKKLHRNALEATSHQASGRNVDRRRIDRESPRANQDPQRAYSPVEAWRRRHGGQRIGDPAYSHVKSLNCARNAAMIQS
jgi:hypothetical protein